MRGTSLALARLLLALTVAGWGGHALAQIPEPPALPPTLRQADPVRQLPPVAGGRKVIATSPGATPTRPALVPIPDDGLGSVHLAPKQAPATVIGASAEAPAAVVKPRQTPPPPRPIGTARPVELAPVEPKPVETPAPTGQSVGLVLDVVGPPTCNAGKPFAYEIVVRNTGAAPLQQVRVMDELPAGASLLNAQPRTDVQGGRLQWNLGTMDAGAEQRVKVELQPGADGEIHSQATATFTVTASLRARLTKPAIKVTKTAPESALVGDTVPFQITVTNPGTGPATGVTIHDTLPEGLRHPEIQERDIEATIGTLGPGETKNITLETKAVKAGRIVNEVIVTADDGLRDRAQAVVVVTEPSLALKKTGPDQTFLHREVEHTLQVTNGGQAQATNVTLVDVVPEGLDFITASDGGTFDPATRQCAWSLGTVGPGQSRSVTIRLVGKTAGEWTNQAVARADRGLEAKAQAPIRVDGVPALMLEVVDLEDPVEVGNETVYEVRVVNQGTTVVTNLKIVAHMPEGIEPLEGDGPAGNSIRGRDVVFEPLAKLAAKADVVYRVKVKGTKPGDWLAEVVLSCDQLGPRPVVEQESTHVFSDAVRDGAKPALPPAPEPVAPNK